MKNLIKISTFFNLNLAWGDSIKSSYFFYILKFPRGKMLDGTTRWEELERIERRLRHEYSELRTRRGWDIKWDVTQI